MGTVSAFEHSLAAASAARAPRKRSVALHILMHAGFLAIAVGLLALYAHFSAEGQSTASMASLIGAAGFGFLPVRDLIRAVFKVEGTAMHLVHLVGGVGLVSLPLTGAVSGTPVLTTAARAPFAIMGAAQAMMHQNEPRNARQAAAMQRFASSLPEVAAIGSPKDLTSPENAKRAIAALTDIIGKAQALGETELDADPGFQSALRQVSTRFGANLGLDAVNLTLSKLAANPTTASAVPNLRRQVDQARRTIAGGAR